MPQLGIGRMVLDAAVAVNLADGKIVTFNVTYSGTITCTGIK